MRNHTFELLVVRRDCRFEEEVTVLRKQYLGMCFAGPYNNYDSTGVGLLLGTREIALTLQNPMLPGSVRLSWLRSMWQVPKSFEPFGFARHHSGL